jgi:hypothetical protein
VVYAFRNVKKRILFAVGRGLPLTTDLLMGDPFFRKYSFLKNLKRNGAALRLNDKQAYELFCLEGI